MIPFFYRGIRLDQKKYRISRKELETIPVPKVIAVPMPGAEAASNRCVKAGERVYKFSQLSMPQNNVPVCSPASGVITQIKMQEHPLAGETACAYINVDPLKKVIRLEPPGEKPDPDQIIALASAAGIIDEYDGIPLYKKLRRYRRAQVDWLGANALDDEPYVCSGLVVLREKPEEVRKGLELAAQACGAKEWKIAVTSRARARRWCGVDQSIKDELEPAGEIYPAWPNLSRRLRKSGKHPGIVGVQALAALHAAVEKGEPQTSVIVTVAGEGAENWKNLKVSIGTPVSQLLQACGVREGAAAYMGSPMKGSPVPDLSVPVTADTRCILAGPANAPEVRRFPCIGCVRCVRACPRGLMPWFIYQEMQHPLEKVDPAALMHVEKCCGCGACAVVCPSGLPLRQVLKDAAELKERGGLD